MTTTPADTFGHFDRWANLRHHLLHNKASAPEAMTLADYAKLSAARRRAFDERRIENIVRSIVIDTPQLHTLSKEYRRAALLSGRDVGRTGVIVSGPATMGKTTAARRIMAQAFERHIARHPDWEELGHVPVVYIEVPPGCNGKTLMGRFLSFFDLPVLPRMTLEERTQMVTERLIRSRTSLIVFDEVHNLSAVGRSQFESAQAIKNLMNHTRAVPLYVGIDLEQSAFTNASLGAQFAARCSVVRLGKLEVNTPAGRKLWKGIIVAYEKRFGLLAHEPGTLLPLTDYLYTRTRGSIGALSRLLTFAAVDLVAAGDAQAETITQEVLAGVQLDLTTERELDLARDAASAPKPGRQRRAA